jgi:hypothetical protein
VDDQGAALRGCGKERHLPPQHVPEGMATVFFACRLKGIAEDVLSKFEGFDLRFSG